MIFNGLCYNKFKLVEYEEAAQMVNYGLKNRVAIITGATSSYSTNLNLLYHKPLKIIVEKYPQPFIFLHFIVI